MTIASLLVNLIRIFVSGIIIIFLTKAVVVDINVLHTVSIKN